MELTEIERYWERLGSADPLWGVLSADRFHGDGAAEEFFATGRRDADVLLGLLRRHGRAIGERALDFGCGVGRLSIALAEHFREVIGVDVSRAMLQRAQAANPYPDRIRFVHNSGSALPLPDDSFDLTLSLMVLQHMPPALSVRYLLELIRVTAPGGHVIVQIPSTPRMGAPMVPEAYRAELSVLRAPTELTSGAAASIGVRITNTSDAEWPAEPLINLGNHWCGDGELLVVDDGRVEVPRPLGPGQSVEVNLTVTAPSAAGDHEMELDLVHEHLSWWADRGSSTLRVPIRVAVPAPSRPEPPNAGAVAGPTPADLTTETWRPAADMLMCGLHHQLVRQLVTHLDCWLLSAEQDELAGPEWISYTYVVAV